jgi:hypothetical protein
MKVAIVSVNPIHHGFIARPLGVIAWLMWPFANRILDDSAKQEALHC